MGLSDGLGAHFLQVGDLTGLGEAARAPGSRGKVLLLAREEGAG